MLHGNEIPLLASGTAPRQEPDLYEYEQNRPNSQRNSRRYFRDGSQQWRPDGSEYDAQVEGERGVPEKPVLPPLWLVVVHWVGSAKLTDAKRIYQKVSAPDRFECMSDPVSDYPTNGARGF